MDDELELRMVLVDGGGGPPSGSPSAPPGSSSAPPAPSSGTVRPPATPPAASGESVTVGGVKLTARDVAALAGKSSAFAEAVGGAGGGFPDLGAAGAAPAAAKRSRTRLPAARSLFPEGYTSEGEADRSSMFVQAGFSSVGEAKQSQAFAGLFDRARQATEAGRSRGRGRAAGLFPEGYSSEGRVKVPVFPEGFSSTGEVGGAAKGADWQSRLLGFARQAGGSPAGLASAAAQALGPQGVIVAAALGAAAVIGKVISDAVVKSIEKLGSVIQHAGVAGAALAGNRNRAAYTEHLNAVAEVVGEVPGLQIQAAQMRLVSKTIDAIGQVTDAFVARGKELSRFSPELAAAGARGRVREIRSDIQESRALGPSLARLTDAQSELTVTVREILLPLKKFLIESLTALVRLVEKPAEYLRRALELWEEIMTWEAKFWDKIKAYVPMLPGLKDLLSALLETFRPKETGAEDFFTQFMNLGSDDNLKLYRRVNDPVKRARDQRLNVPAFNGL